MKIVHVYTTGCLLCKESIKGIKSWQLTYQKVYQDYFKLGLQWNRSESVVDLKQNYEQYVQNLTFDEHAFTAITDRSYRSLMLQISKFWLYSQEKSQIKA